MSEGKIDIIMLWVILFVFFVIFIVWLWFRKRIFKTKDFDGLSGNEKEKRKNSMKMERTKNIERQIKDEKKSRDEKEVREIEKVKEREKDLLMRVNSAEEKIKNKEILHMEIKKEIKSEEFFEKSDSIFERLRKSVFKTRTQLLKNMSNVILGKKEIDEDLLDDLEEVLIGSDIGPETTLRIIDSITEKVDRKELTNPDVLQEEIKQEILKIVSKTYPSKVSSGRKPLIFLLVGVNGVGKTTTIGKIAAQYREKGKKVLLGAGDTFRAAAIDQLVEWSVRVDCDILKKDPNSDPSAVIHETVQKGINEDYDIVICDTAGRLHTKKNLMDELKKMIRVVRKLIPDAPHEIFLVLDATTGQNAIFQTREFKEVTELTGLIITKLDGTSKGGVVIGIVNEFDIPVRYIGIGEKVEDLRDFDATQFTESIFD